MQVIVINVDLELSINLVVNCRGVDPVLKMGGGGDGGPIYIDIYVCIIIIYVI